MNGSAQANNKPFTLRSNKGDVGDYIKQLDKNLLQLWGAHSQTRTEHLKLKKRVDNGEIDHASLENLNSTNYTHLSALNAEDLTDKGYTTLHKHQWYDNTSVYIISGQTHTINTDYSQYVYSGTLSGVVTLPSATGSGRRFTLKNAVSSTVQLKGGGTQTIDGDLTQNLYEEESIDVIDIINGKWSIV
jgi:hypothetical protein